MPSVPGKFDNGILLGNKPQTNLFANLLICASIWCCPNKLTFESTLKPIMVEKKKVQVYWAAMARQGKQA